MKKHFFKKSPQQLVNAIKGKIKLNVGCGTDYKKGWINIDNNTDNNIEKLDLNWDLRNPLPFSDNSVDFIYNEHLFEHLTPTEAVIVIKDLMRVLKPGGVLRIAMPDLESIVHQYLDRDLNNDPLISRWHADIKTRAESINTSFRSWGHQWLYDWEELKRRLKDSGCKTIYRCDLQKSKYQELRNLETRQESLLIVEVVK